MRLRRRLRVPLLAVLMAAGIVATDFFQRRPSGVERVDPNALVRPAPSENALRSTRSTSESQSQRSLSAENVPPPVATELSDETVVEIRELAEADPFTVAESAFRENTGALRARMLLEALPLWAARDPASAAEWLTARAPARELDLGLLALARHPAFVAKMPDAAFSLASEIVDPSLRISAQRSIVQDWMPRDASRIRGIVERTRDLTPSDRALLLSELEGLLASR